MTPNLIHNIHDRFMRHLLAEKELAISFLREYLPAQLSELIDFDTLTYKETSYLSKNLKSSFSDMVWQVKLYSDYQLRICLLLEHKSYVDPYVTFQLLEYLALGYQKQVREKKEPKLIVPILYYHGDRSWDYKGMGDFFSGLPDWWRKYLPEYETVYINLKQISGDRILGLRNGLLRSALLLQKNYFDPEELNRNIFNILQSLDQYLETDAAESIFVYLIRNEGLDFRQFRKEMEVLPTIFNSKMNSIYDQLIQQGIKNGLEQGIEKGVEKGKIEVIRNLLQTGKFTVSEIANFTDMPEKIVKELAKGK